MKFLILLLCVSGLSFSQNKTKLEKYMNAQASINGFSGTVLVTKGDSILLKKAYGFADYEWKIPTTLDTKFSLASVSKQFTAVAILQLVEKGKLSLEDKLIQYFPKFPKANAITIKMMLTHTAGFQMDFDELYLAKTSLQKDTVLEHIAEKSFLFEPGTNVSYSNIGYYLLSQIIEKVSEQPYATYLKQNIFKRAKMYNTGVSTNDSIVSKLAKTYYLKENVLVKNPYINWNYNIGHDGVYTTIDDLFLWNKALFETNKLLNKNAKKKMLTSYNKHNFGFGLLINPFYNHNHELVAHDGSFFGVMTSFNKFIKDDIFITVLSNNQSPSYLIAYALSAIIFNKPVEIPYKHVQVKINPEIYNDYIGTYENVTILKKNNKLYYAKYNDVLLPESETKFFLSKNNNRTVEFIKNKKGKVTAIIVAKAGVLQRFKKKSK
ncbi:serine hydrolase [Aquimarina longa]|uniref:serine hydrolase n=1 Tax=Aquimarina longa TaxID=1080221 RepID=UPI0007858A8A|nr:serine hydrolase [Aquimarina longa]